VAKKSFRAVVQKIANGHRGRYAVATSGDILGSITFSLAYPCWQGDDDPEPGTVVILSGLRKKRAGWRALDARYLQPFDEEEMG
jgi:hypothetical protein